MIKKDEYGIIIQHRPDEPNYKDGGDSCQKTSIAVIAGLFYPGCLFDFIVAGKVVRHPIQEPYNDPKETSRDQLIPLLAASFLFGYHRNRIYKYFINKDFLGMPDVQWFLRTCSGDIKYSWLGDKFIKLSIWYASRFDVDHELNQLFSVVLSLDHAYKTDYTKLLCRSHPDWRKNLRDYWSGWRGNSEIGEAFIKRIERELN